MLINPFLGRFVVIWTNRQDCGETVSFKVFYFFNYSSCIITTNSGNQRNTIRIHFNYKIKYLSLFFL
ncbi:hypothetical protein D3C87_1904520 [compost metagenome]